MSLHIYFFFCEPEEHDKCILSRTTKCQLNTLVEGMSELVSFLSSVSKMTVYRLYY
jgi:hypothetical protein